MNPALEQAAQILPLRLREAVQSSITDAEELHLRTGRILTWCASDGRERPVLLGGYPLTVTGEELRLTLELATRASYHTVQRKLSAGFLPLRGGHRRRRSARAFLFCRQPSRRLRSRDLRRGIFPRSH